ncbi:MAG: SAM-dependent methyltransferase [Caulobacteraceae bacterium]|nr:SAM-dependent methyltransferase [Caulobacteraceae bacterium]
MTLPRIAERATVLSAAPWPDYSLIDSGEGRKLEAYGRVKVIRPEPQCLWRSRRDPGEWALADAAFEPTDEDEAGRWRFGRPVPDAWPMAWRDVKFNARLTAFRHLGVFVEQAANWEWLDARIRAAGRPMKVLNLFGYTGVASLVCAAAGASVTHVDASKKAVGWARENAALSGIDTVRWIVEDARAFLKREARRGSFYDGVILDPPKYGRGPEGEVFKLMDDLPELIGLCAALLGDQADFLLLNAYAERLSGLALSGLLAEAVGARGGQIDWGELALMEMAGDRGVGVSFFARWSA